MGRLLTLSSGWFHPLQIPGAMILADPRNQADLTFNSTTISAMANRGTTGAGNFAQGIALRQPQFVANGINGRAALEFRYDGTNPSSMAIVDSPGLDYAATTALLVGLRVTDTNGNEHLAGKYSTISEQRENRLLIDNVDRLAGGASPDGTATGIAIPYIAVPTIGTATPFIADYQLQPGASATTLNGTITSALSSPATVFNGAASYEVGARQVSADPFAGRLSFLVVYNSYLNSVALTLLRQWASVEFGIALA